ncbi:MAG: hypothetical protein FWG82_00750 [Oscillospiraceae bacterium]|nr:hypothetical protein [Oscillospiraceae bacterium]
MKRLQKSLSLLLALIFLLGTFGVAATANSPSLIYEIRLIGIGEPLTSPPTGEVTHGRFRFEAVVPTEFLTQTAQWDWNFTKALPGETGKTLADYHNNGVAAVLFNGVIYYDSGQQVPNPGGSMVQELNSFTRNLYPGYYFVSMYYQDIGGIPVSRNFPPQLFPIPLPAVNRADLNALVTKAMVLRNRSHQYDTTEPTWITFADTLDAAKDMVANYFSGPTEIAAMITDLQAAYDALVVLNDTIPVTPASFFSLILEIFQFIMNVNRDRTIGDIFAELRDALLGSMFG